MGKVYIGSAGAEDHRKPDSVGVYCILRFVIRLHGITSLRNPNISSAHADLNLSVDPRQIYYGRPQ